MNSEYVMQVLNEMLTLAAVISFPLLGIGIFVGLIVAIFMAATQIQEASLNFVPKIFAIGIALVVVGPWMIDTLVNYTVDLLAGIVELGPGVHR
jgi:flagellar biosynthetic protein FliQ